MTVPYLSRTLRNSTAGITPKVGAWQAEDPTIAGRLAKATSADGVPLANLAQSMPGIWGYARFFHAAWSAPDHPHHNRIVEIWRRFVILVALRSRSRAGDITLRPIVLPRPDATLATGIVQIATFRDAAGLQFPHDVLGTDRETPVELSAVLCGNQVIGLVLPGLLALPARCMLDAETLPQGLKDRFPLRRLDRLGEVEWREFYHKEYTLRRLGDLNAFLQNAISDLQKRLDGATAPNLAMSLLLDHLRRFEQRLAVMTAGTTLPTWVDSPQQNFPTGTLFRFVPQDAEPLPLARISARPLAEATDGKTGYVLVTPNISDPDYRELAVHGATLVGDVADRRLLGKDRLELMYKSSGNRPGTLLVSDDDLFEPTLVAFTAEPQAPQKIGLDNRFLYPATPLALAILGPQGLRQRMTVLQGSSDTEVRVGLRLEVGGAWGQEFQLVRVYSTQNGTLRKAAAPTCLAIWPDSSIPDTDDHRSGTLTLVYQTRDSQHIEFRAKRLLSRTALAARLAALLGDTARLEQPPSLRPDPKDDRGAVAMLEAGQHELLRAREPAEAIECAAGDASGLLLIDERREVFSEDDSSRCVVSIDFGTSSTTMAIAIDGKEGEVSMSPHVWIPFVNADIDAMLHMPGGQRASSAYSAAAGNFIPPSNSISMPFPSLIQIRSGQGIDATTDVPLLRGCIPFPSEMGTSSVADLLRRPPRGATTEFDLKWSTEHGTRRVVEHLLREVMLIALGHARGRGVTKQRITWRLSLPRTLPPDVQRLFQEEARNACTSVLGFAPPQERLQFYWESVAIYSYLLHHDRRAHAPVMILFDIGGRSTDIAIVDIADRQGGLVMDGSAEIAGRRLLVEHWARSENSPNGMLKSLDTEAGEQAGAGTSDPIRRRVTLLELLLSDPEFRLEAALEGESSRHELIAQSRERVQFGFLGLVYFVIFHALTRIARAPGFVPGRPLGLYLGGRASRIVQLFCLSDTELEQQLRKLMAKWLTQAGYLEQGRGQFDLTISITNNPKMEVAIGGLHCDGLVAIDSSRADTMETTAKRRGYSDMQSQLMAPPMDGPGTIDSFLQEVQGLFRLDATKFSTIKGRTGPSMRNPASFPGFQGFSTGPLAPEYDPRLDPRREFILTLAALLDEWPGQAAVS